MEGLGNKWSGFQMIQKKTKLVLQQKSSNTETQPNTESQYWMLFWYGYSVFELLNHKATFITYWRINSDCY